MPITEGAIPLALPGGQGMATRHPKPASKPLDLATPAKGQIAFATHSHGLARAPAFWKTSKRAFKG